MSDYPIKWHKTSHGYDDDMNPIRECESYVLITESGAVEAWRTPSSTIMQDSPFNQTRYFGGIEVHSKTPMYPGQEDRGVYCEWTRGDCYHDGSSMAFDGIEHSFDSPTYIFSVLAGWAESNLNTNTQEQ